MIGRPMRVRAEAARELIRHKELSPEIALSYVVWPSLGLEDASRRKRRVFTDEDRARARELEADGLSREEIAGVLGCARTTLNGWLSRSDWQRADLDLAAGGSLG